jgi:hypothetical protein
MSKPLIRLVSGDSAPDLIFQLTDRSNGTPFDLTESSIMVFMKFRQRSDDETLADIACEKTIPESGICTLRWPPGVLDVEEGRYEGEVYLNDDGDVQTDFEVLKFKVREGFADVV